MSSRAPWSRVGPSALSRFACLCFALLAACTLPASCASELSVGENFPESGAGRDAGGGNGGTIGGWGGFDGALDSERPPPLPCVTSVCQGAVFACGDCLDNEGDGRVDAADPECLGPCDDAEESLSSGIPGQNNAPCRQDCYFDRDTGAGNDGCYWSHRCDPLALPDGFPPSGDPRCAYDPDETIPGTSGRCADLARAQGEGCLDQCLPITPNGCDCFGCCELPAGSGRHVFLAPSRDEQTSCELSSIDDPERCRPCTPVLSCYNSCGPCETCVGREGSAPDCGDAASSGCGVGSGRCGGTTGRSCPALQYCITGCCVDIAF